MCFKNKIQQIHLYFVFQIHIEKMYFVFVFKILLKNVFVFEINFRSILPSSPALILRPDVVSLLGKILVKMYVVKYI